MFKNRSTQACGSEHSGLVKGVPSYGRALELDEFQIPSNLNHSVFLQFYGNRETTNT